MKVLITGASGFLGNYLKNYLSKYQVTALTSSDLDLSDVGTVVDFFNKSEQFDVIVNCAAKGRYSATAKDEEILRTNLKIFMNLMSCQHKFARLINIGTGAEFGLNNNVVQAKESDIFQVSPDESYGLSKNIISRMATALPNVYTVRLFGCFDPSEPSRRLLSGFIESIKTNGSFTVTNDRYADYVSVKDFALLIDMIIQGQVTDRDLNMVYKEKYMLSEILRKYCNLHNIDDKVITVANSIDKNYTGSSGLLDRYNFDFQGLDAALKEYKYE